MAKVGIILETEEDAQQKDAIEDQKSAATPKNNTARKLTTFFISHELPKIIHEFPATHNYIPTPLRLERGGCSGEGEKLFITFNAEKHGVTNNLRTFAA